MADYHFTYRRPLDATDLEQGDLLLNTEGLARVIGEVHPHYLRADYSHFLVLTQSCDLVRRGGPCKARYITVAAVRPLTLVIEREVEQYQTNFEREGGLCSRKYRGRLENFLQSILNNNLSEYFYLHEDAELGVDRPRCAFLRLSIALKSHEHYGTCTEARMLSLTEIFQAKLGWLVGNIYSRVGTEDWVPRFATRESFQMMTEAVLDESLEWVDDNRLRQAKGSAGAAALLGQGRDAIRHHVATAAVRDRRQMAYDRVVSILQNMGFATDDATAQRLMTRLTNDQALSNLVPK